MSVGLRWIAGGWLAGCGSLAVGDRGPEGAGPPGPPGACEQAEPGRLLRRLTHPEYARTVADLLGVEAAAGTFAADPIVDGFRNDAAALGVSDLLADQYRTSAEALAAAADLRSSLPCDPAAVGDATCASLFIEDFGFRAFRRPLTQADIHRYLAVWTEVALEDGFDAGIEWVVVAMLQSPHFLYRSELGVQVAPGRFELTGWELAADLSYTFWGTTPDAELLAEAAAGALDTPEGLLAAAAARADDPRTLETVADAVEVWLDTSQLATVSRDGLTPELRASMQAETRAVARDVAGAGGTLADLMLTRYTLVDAGLAEHYGLPGSGRVELDGVRYGGVLTHGSVLTTHGRPEGSGPVQRGVTVRERLLCEDLPPPPSNLDVSPPPVDPALSTRERYAQHAADPACSSCHALIDPLGFAFEGYDQLGRRRDDDGGHPIDDAGELDGVAFRGPFELAEVLLDDPRFRSCFVRTWRRHATGVAACGEDLGPDVGLLEPLVEIPRLPGFRERAGGADELDSLAVGTRIEPVPPDEPELPEGEVTLELTVVNDWGAGYCADGVVANGSDATTSWAVRTAADGIVNNVWNAVVTDDGGDWVFEGVDWNASLAPGATATFGFCADR
ncbi:MAG: DUF1588 domain-containing protein [Myxococcota bacterium]